MLTAMTVRTTVLKLLSHPEVQAALFLIAVELVAKGSTGVYDKVIDKVARHVAAEIDKQKAVIA